MRIMQTKNGKTKSFIRAKPGMVAPLFFFFIASSLASYSRYDTFNPIFHVEQVLPSTMPAPNKEKATDGDAEASTPEAKFEVKGTTLEIKIPVADKEELVGILRDLDNREAIESLEFRYEYEDDDPPMLDFSLDLNDFLPAVRNLSMEHCFMSVFNVRSSTIETLDIGGINCYEIQHFAFHMPELR